MCAHHPTGTATPLALTFTYAMPAPAGSGGGWAREDDEPAAAAASGARVSRYYRHLPREREEYAARRALFLRTYRFTTRGEEEEEEDKGLRGRVARRLREACVSGRGAVARAASRARWWLGAGLARAYSLQLGCFGAPPNRRKYHYLHCFA